MVVVSALLGPCTGNWKEVTPQVKMKAVPTRKGSGCCVARKGSKTKQILKTPQIATTLALLINCFNKLAFLEKEERYSV